MDEETKETMVPAEMPHHDLMELFKEMSWGDMIRRVIRGLHASRDSGDYKFAKLQILRLWAPFSAIAVPAIAVLALFVFSAMNAGKDRVVDVVLLDPDKMEKELDPIKDIEQPLEQPETTEVAEVDPDNRAPNDDPNDRPAPNQPFSPQPAPFDSVAMTKSPVVMPGIYSSRNPGQRGAALAGFGGGHGTEAAVYLALRWLKKNQEADGSWNTASGGGPPDGGPAAPAMTGLALLTYLAHGETPVSEEFGRTIEKAIKWLIDNQTPDGRFKGSDGHEYSLPIATYALCEGYTLTKIPMLQDVATKSVNVIVKGQNPTFLWNYNCENGSDRNDMSYSGWCMQALKAASMANLDVPGLKECMVKAVQGCKLSFVSMGEGGGGNFSYARVGKGPGDKNAGLTGVGVLCMQLLGAGRDSAATKGLVFLDTATCNWDAPWGGNPIYYWYYITQAKFHAGGTIWKTWNNQFSPTLQKSIIVIPKAIQDPKGRWVDIGYWPPAGKKDKDGKVASGEHCKSYVYNTTLCALMLEVYYRYLPSYKPPEDALKDVTFEDKTQDIDVQIK